MLYSQTARVLVSKLTPLSLSKRLITLSPAILLHDVARDMDGSGAGSEVTPRLRISDTGLVGLEVPRVGAGLPDVKISRSGSCNNGHVGSRPCITAWDHLIRGMFRDAKLSTAALGPNSCKTKELKIRRIGSQNACSSPNYLIK